MCSKTASHRVEHDLLGAVNVPVEAAYGAQTQRALQNFPLNGEKSFADYPELLAAMLKIKKATMLANERAGTITPDLSRAIMDAVDTLLAELPADQFPVHSFHGGGGISFNMNVNEVVANYANRDGFDQPFGSYSPIHPNDHVNLNQSTNDVFATACHFAIKNRWHDLDRELGRLAESFSALGDKWQHVQRISRTCLQDAVEISFADFFSGYAGFCARARARLTSATAELNHLCMGGTLVGRLVDVDPNYLQQLYPALQEVFGDQDIQRTENFFDACQNLDDMVHVAQQLELTARGLIKIAMDLRLISSGPETGFGEITLPAVQPGSSAMPGKINPSVPEFMVQCSFQAIGRCHSAAMAIDHGELDLNIWESPVVINILDAMSCLAAGVRVLREKCIDGIEVNIEKNMRNINALIPLMTRLKLAKGYSYATRVFKEHDGDAERIREHTQNILGS